MVKAFCGLLVAFIVAAALVGTIAWSTQSNSHEMVLRPETLDSLINFQRESLTGHQP